MYGPQLFGLTEEFGTILPHSIDVLLKAGKLIKPKSKKKVTLTIKEFDVVSQKWRDVTETTASIEQAKFASGGFRDAHHAS